MTDRATLFNDICAGVAVLTAVKYYPHPSYFRTLCAGWSVYSCTGRKMSLHFKTLLYRHATHSFGHLPGSVWARGGGGGCCTGKGCGVTWLNRCNNKMFTCAHDWLYDTKRAEYCKWLYFLETLTESRIKTPLWLHQPPWMWIIGYGIDGYILFCLMNIS